MIDFYHINTFFCLEDEMKLLLWHFINISCSLGNNVNTENSAIKPTKELQQTEIT